MFFVLLFLLISLSVLASYLFYLNDIRKTRNIPGPFPLPFVGSGHKFLGSSFQFVQSLSDFFKVYGDIVRVYVLNERFVLLKNPKHVEAIVSKTEYITKGTSYTYLHPWLGQGLLTASGRRWFVHRKFLTGAFHFNILKTFLPIFLKNDEVLIKKLNAIADGRSVNIFPYMALLALDNISEAAMGVSVNAQNDSKSAYVNAVNEISELTFKRMRHPVLGVNVLFNLAPQRLVQEKTLRLLHGFTTKVVEDRRKVLEESKTTIENYEIDSDIGLKKKSAFLDLLLLSDVEGQKLNTDVIREEVDTFMFEGHDTTTSGLSFSLYCISQHKDVQEKVFKEQQDIFADDMNRQPTYADLSNMRYIEQVIKESLRLYPSVPLIGRLTTEDAYIGEYFIPKDTNITIDILEMQRSPEVFDDPLTFRPERFEANAEQKNPYSFLAFSAGPRNCIGQKFAMMELKLVLSSIVRRFHILPSDEEPMLSADLILRSENGVHIKLLPRNNIVNSK